MNHFDVLKNAPGDRSLNARDLKVLMHILSRVPVETMQSYISRDQISEATNIKKNHISETTAKLCRLGWLKKEGNGGRSSFVKYEITLPKMVLLSKEKKDDKGVPKQDKRSPDSGRDKETKESQNGIKGVPKQDKRSPDSGRGKKEPQKEPQKEPHKDIRARNKFNFTTCPKELYRSVIEFVEYRYRKEKRKQDFTQETVDKIIRKAVKIDSNGFDYQSVIDDSIEAGWQGVFPKDHHKKIQTANTKTSSADGYLTFDQRRTQANNQAAIDFANEIQQEAVNG